MEQKLENENIQKLRIFNTIGLYYNKTLLKAAPQCAEIWGVLKANSEKGIINSAKEEEKAQNIWMKNWMSKSTEVFGILLERSFKKIINDQKEVETTQTDDKEGSVLLGRGVEKPHYEIPDRRF